MRVRRIVPFLLFGLLLGAQGIAAAPAGAQAENAEAPASASQPAKAAAGYSSEPTVTFLQVFKGSTPEYIRIVVDDHGSATYDIRQLSDQPSPQPFHVSSALTAKIFALAADLRDFSGIHLNVRRHIADLGEKTLTYADANQTHEVSFNYTLNSKANDLLDIFQGLSVADQYLDQLHNAMRYDPLGLDDVLTRLQSDLASGMVADRRVLVPSLRQIVSNQQFMNIARNRASRILASIGQPANQSR